MTTPNGDDSVDALRHLVAAEPFDLALRFRYGVALFRSGEVRLAVPELQQARQHPDHRKAATKLLGEIFERLGMEEVAAHLRRGVEDDGSPGGDPEPAAKPAPVRPVSPLSGSVAKQLPDCEAEDD